MDNSTGRDDFSRTGNSSPAPARRRIRRRHRVRRSQGRKQETQAKIKTSNTVYDPAVLLALFTPSRTDWRRSMVAYSSVMLCLIELNVCSTWFPAARELRAFSTSPRVKSERLRAQLRSEAAFSIWYSSWVRRNITERSLRLRHIAQVVLQQS